MSPSEILHLFLTLLLIVGIEAILSFDNAAVLALIVNKNLPANQRKKALKYGIVGAFLFRGLSLFFVSWILNNPTFGAAFKLVGGLYLLWLGYKGLTPEKDSMEEGEVGWADGLLKRLGIGVFWSTVLIVEMVDIVFSLDNLVAVVSLSDNIVIVIVGVVLGIITMRFVAQRFSVLMVKYPTLEVSAFIVIFLLGLKLIIGGTCDYVSSFHYIKTVLESHLFDLIFSGVMAAIFILPLYKNRSNAESKNIR